MIGMLVLLFQLIYWFFRPEFVQAVKIPPIMPLIPYFTSIFNVEWLPPFYFTYWIIALAVTAVSHEFFHGIFAKARDIKIKSTGFAFLGPFVGAFVEPDENKVRKLKIKKQLGFLSAGSFANVLVTFIFLIIMWLFFISAFAPAGAIFNTYTFARVNVSDIGWIDDLSFVMNLDGKFNLTEIEAGDVKYFVNDDNLERLKNSSTEYIYAFEDAPALNAGLAGVITEFDGVEIKNNEDLSSALSEKKPGDNVKIKTLFNDSTREYEIQLASRPDDESRAYLGIAVIRTDFSSVMGRIRTRIAFFRDPNTYYEPKLGDFTIFIYNLIWWIILINLSVALVNMMPIGIFDGGRVFYLTVLGLTKSQKIAKKAFKISTIFFLLIFLLLTYLWFIYR